jgi:OmpA-OmpF porin, OOP family
MTTKLLSLAAVLSLAASQTVLAQDIPSNGSKAYVIDTNGNIVRDGFGGCVRTIHWTKETAIAKCEGWPETQADTPAKTAETKQETPAEAPTEAATETPKTTSKPQAADKGSNLGQAAVATTAAVVVIKDDVPAAFEGFFVTSKADLKPQAKEKLDAYADYMQRHPDIQIKITGYTDSLGSKTYNQTLSENRAESVKNYLTSKGIDANRIQAEGKGPQNPVATNKTAEGRAKNRRVEIAILK